MKEETINTITENRIIVEIKDFPPDAMLYSVEALIKGGIKAVQIVLSEPGSETERDDLLRIEALKKCFGKDIKVGAGNVLCERSVRLVKGANADFISAPNADKDVIQRANSVFLPMIAGAFTPSEIIAAKHWGADFINLFPAKVAGNYEYAATVAKAVPTVPLIASGDIGYNDLLLLTKAGIKMFFVGSQIANLTLAIRKEYQIMTAEAKRYTDLLGKI